MNSSREKGRRNRSSVLQSDLETRLSFYRVFSRQRFTEPLLLKECTDPFNKLGFRILSIYQEPKLNQKFHAVVVQRTATNCIIKCAHVQSSFLFLYVFFF